MLHARAQQALRTPAPRAQPPKTDSSVGKQDVEPTPEGKGRLPWVSMVSLLYPAGAMIYAAWLGAPLLVAIGYGIANLGYLLFGAGVFVGTFKITFKILHLKKKGHVFVYAFIAFAVRNPSMQLR